MELTPMQKATNSLKALGHGELLSLAHAYLESHISPARSWARTNPNTPARKRSAIASRS